MVETLSRDPSPISNEAEPELDVMGELAELHFRLGREGV